MVGAKNELKLPHLRQHCVEKPFDKSFSAVVWPGMQAFDFSVVAKLYGLASSKNSAACADCFCWVCDAPWKDCASWGLHCHASDKDPVWAAERQQKACARAAKERAASAAAAAASSSSSSSSSRSSSSGAAAAAAAGPSSSRSGSRTSSPWSESLRPMSSANPPSYLLCQSPELPRRPAPEHLVSGLGCLGRRSRGHALGLPTAELVSRELRGLREHAPSLPSLSSSQPPSAAPWGYGYLKQPQQPGSRHRPRRRAEPRAEPMLSRPPCRPGSF